MEISRLSLHYSSANLSEEESNSLINILDRKKYHERLQATRSAEEQIQPRYAAPIYPLIILTLTLLPSCLQQLFRKDQYWFEHG